MQKRKIFISFFFLIGLLILTGCSGQSFDKLYEESKRPEVSTDDTGKVKNDPATTSLEPTNENVDFYQAIQSKPAPISIYEIPLSRETKVMAGADGSMIWSDEIALKQGTLTIKASIDPLTADHQPVYLIKNHSFTAEDINRAIAVLFPNIQGMIQNNISRFEVMSELESIRLGRFAGIDSETGNPIYQPYNGQGQEIAQLEELLLSMPNDIVYPNEAFDFSKPHSYKFVTMDNKLLFLDTNANELQARSDRSTSVIPESDLSNTTVKDIALRTYINSIPIAPNPLIETTINSLVGALGPSGLVQIKLERALLIDTETNIVESAGYYYVFARSIGDTNMVHIRSYESNSDLYYGQSDVSISPPACNYETVGVFLDHSGIRYIEWKNPFDPIEIVNQNVHMIEFTDIQRIIRENVISLANQNNEELWGKDITIKRISLTNCIQPTQGMSDCAYLAPAWLVFATASSQNSVPDEFIFAISAIDGKMIPLDW